jgi:hypothetical protein
MSLEESGHGMLVISICVCLLAEYDSGRDLVKEDVASCTSLGLIILPRTLLEELLHRQSCSIERLPNVRVLKRCSIGRSDDKNKELD